MKKHIVVLTGAGISQESGINTFRDSNGLWENHDIRDVASPEGFIRNPELVLNFYNLRRRQLAEVQSNAAHFFLAELEAHYDITIITQNVDDLHERAGSSNIIHLHGELKKSRSIAQTDTIFDQPGDILLGDLAPDGHQLRPHIVWFGEAVPMIEPSVELCQKADIFIIIGTSLAVYPAAGLVNYTPSTAKKYLIDPKEVKGDLRGIKFIQEMASVGVKRVVDEILLENKFFEN